MTDFAWAVIENIAILCAACFLIWLTGSGWWILLCVLCNTGTAKTWRGK